MSDRDIYQILESLDAAQKSVKQLPALFKPANTSPQLSGTYPGRNATRGYMVGEGEKESLDDMTPMGRAVTYRVANQRPEWFMKYGLDAVMQAIQDVTGGEDDWEEIGSSDVSAYVGYVGDRLRDHYSSREEMQDRKPFAERDLSETSDYARRREREEAIISGKKPARKKAPAQTSDYAKRREQQKKQGVAEAGPFSYGSKKPRKGSVADLAAKKRKEQEKGNPPIEPKDQMVGVAKVTKGVAEATGNPGMPHDFTAVQPGAEVWYKGRFAGWTTGKVYDDPYGKHGKMVAFEPNPSEFPGDEGRTLSLPYDEVSLRKSTSIGKLKGPKQGVAEDTEQVYKVVAVDKSNALKKPTKLNVKASSIEDVFSRLAANDWYALSINGVEVIAGKRLKQGVAEGSDKDNEDNNEPELKQTRAENEFARTANQASKDFNKWAQDEHKKQKGVAEGLRDGEYHLATVTLDDGTTHKVKIRSDEGFREPIERHFQKQGRQVTDIDVDWSVRSDLSEASEDTFYPGAEIIRARNGRPVGEIYRDNTGTWGYFSYRADYGADGLDSREDAMEELKLLHAQTGRGHPDYTIKGEVNEGRDTATEDVLSTIKKKLGDYLQDVATAIKTDPDLKDKIPQSIDKISAVKTIKTDDGREIKIHGNEDDGFRISIKSKDLKTAFKNLDEAIMAAEMYCARRRQKALEADYIDEKTS